MTTYYWTNNTTAWRGTDGGKDSDPAFIGWSRTSGGNSVNAYPSGSQDIAVFDLGSGTCDLSSAGVELAAVRIIGWIGGFTFGATLSASDWVIESDASYISGSKRALCTGVCTLGGEASRLPGWLDFVTGTTLIVQKSGVGLGGIHAATMIVVDETVETLTLTADLTARDIRIGSVEGAAFPLASIATNGFELTLIERTPEPPAVPQGRIAYIEVFDVPYPLTIHVRWTPVPEAAEYVVELSRDAQSGWWGAFRGPGEPYKTSIRATISSGLEHATTYYVRIKSVAGDLESDWSNLLSVTTIPRGPGNLRAVSVGSTAINLNWDKWEETIFRTHYMVYYSRSPGMIGATLAFRENDVLGCTIAKLLPSTAYYFAMRAYRLSSPDYESDWTEVLAVTTRATPVLPGVPTNLTAKSVSSKAILLGWSTAANASRYVLERSGSDMGGWSEVYRGAELSFEDAALSPETTYWYRVKAINDDGDSAWSKLASATTPEREPEPLPHVLSLEERIQRYWKTTFPLESRISVERLSTGPTTRTERPFLNLIRGESKIVLASNFCDPPCEIAFRLELHHDSLETGTDLAELIRTQLDRTRLSIEDEPATLLLLTQSKYRCESENHWVFVLEFRALTSGCC